MEGRPLLYFAYTSMLSPTRLGEVAPSAAFQFVAHLPETKLIFPIQKNGKWHGALPSVRPEPGNTVWGAIFEISSKELTAMDEVEKKEGRIRVTLSAMDRAGKRHEVATHVAKSNGREDGDPSPDYMALVLEGGRHWELPAGWVAGIEEYVVGVV